MGKKIRIRKVSNLGAVWDYRRFVFLVFSAVLGSGWFYPVGFVGAELRESGESFRTKSRGIELGVQAEYRPESVPLTTEKIWELDPLQTNPHRTRWLVVRHSRLAELKPVELKNHKIGVEATHILSLVQGYVRGPGVWYSSESRFPCRQNPDFDYSTQEGARVAAVAAGDLWVKLLNDNQIKLSLLIKRISAENKENALFQAESIFKKWLAAVDQEWRSQIDPEIDGRARRSSEVDRISGFIPGKIRRQEWDYYLEQARSQGRCSSGLQASSSSTAEEFQSQARWQDQMEAPASGPVPPPTALLARSPVKLWNGLFSIRLNVRIADKILNGRFLIDSTLSQSVMSPQWLENQGIYPVWVELLNSEPVVISGGDLWKGRSHLGRPARVDRLELGGLILPIQDLVLLETDFFYPPDFLGTCCDGVLGSDFLKHYPIEFSPGPPVEMRVWPKEGFHLSAEASWVEVSQDEAGSPISACKLDSPGLQLFGVRWNTGSQAAINFSSSVRSGTKNLWQLDCHHQEIAAHLPVGPGAAEGLGRFPAADIGMPLVLSSKGMTFDLPHGRIWFSQGIPIQNRIFRNESGLLLKYLFVEGDRSLQVIEIKKKSPAEALLKWGLRPGTAVTSIDSLPVEDLDAWEVERRLSGAYGKTVTLQWKTSKGVKVVPLNLGSTPLGSP